MLEVAVIIGGALVAFFAMLLWANGGRFKSEDATLTPVTPLVPADIGFTIDILVLVPPDRRMTVLRSMFVGAIVGGAKAMAGSAVMAAVVKTILVAPMSGIIRRIALLAVGSVVAWPILGRRDRGSPTQDQKCNCRTPVLLWSF